MRDEFSQRTRILVGDDGMRRLLQAKVAVFGIGGVGSYAVEALGRAGIGTLVLVDFDTIRPSNLNRQLPATVDTIGAVKAEAMAARLRTINPEIGVVVHARRFTRADAGELLTADVDFVIDAIDSLTAKVNLIHECVVRGIPLVSSMGSGGKLCAEMIRVGDLFDSRSCPLAKLVRKRLRRRGVASGVPAVYSEELPILAGRTAGAEADAAAGSGGEAAGVHGTISYMPALFGMHCAGYVVQRLLDGLPFVRRGETAPTVR